MALFSQANGHTCTGSRDFDQDPRGMGVFVGGNSKIPGSSEL